VGGINLLKPALRLITSYRLVIEEVTGSEVITITSNTRWVESVQLKEAENQEVLPDIRSALRADMTGI
jgi:hypothetical protein